MYDGAARIEGLEVIENMGIDTLSLDKEVFVSVNNLSIFSDIEEQCSVLHNRIVLLVDTSVKPEEMYINRIKELKDKGFKIAMRKIQVQDFEKYRPILSNIDYILLNHKKIDIEIGRAHV